MQPYHAEAIINKDGKIILPLPFPPFQVGVKVDIFITLSDEAFEDKEWKEMAVREFLRGYADEDSVYDAL